MFWFFLFTLNKLIDFNSRVSIEEFNFFKTVRDAFRGSLDFVRRTGKRSRQRHAEMIAKLLEIDHGLGRHGPIFPVIDNGRGTACNLGELLRRNFLVFFELRQERRERCCFLIIAFLSGHISYLSETPTPTNVIRLIDHISINRIWRAKHIISHVNIRTHFTGHIMSSESIIVEWDNN